MIEFIEESHTYLVDGIIVPSVTQIINWATGTYKDVPQHILDKAAAYGTGVHDLIEKYERGEEIVFNPDMEDERRALDEWTMLANLHDIEVLNMEQMVAYEHEFAGRYDILAMVNGKKTLIDIKTTSEYHKRNLEIQEGLYLLGLKEEIDCACVWLPKNKPGQYIKVDPIDFEERMLLLQRFKAGLEPFPERNELEGMNIYTVEQTDKLRLFYSLKDDVERIEKEAKAKLLQLMQEKNIKSFENDDWKVTKKEAYTRTSVDTAKMKEDGIYENYTKESIVPESVVITPKWLKREKERLT